MAARIKLFSESRPPGVAWLVLLAAASANALAEPLPDPTRPPPEIINSSGIMGQTGEPVVPASENKGLQTVIISPDRRSAIIDGHPVNLGAKFGDLTLIQVKEGAVILRDARGKLISMTMFPGVGIRNRNAASRQEQDKTGTNPAESQRSNNTNPQVEPREAK